MANVNELTRAMRERRASDAEENDRRYWAMVRACAEGREPTPDEIVGVLDALGRDPHQFQDDVAKVSKRHQAVARMKAKPATQARHDAVKAEIKAAITAAEEAMARANERHQALLPELRRLEHELDFAGRAKSELLQTCPYPDLTGRDREIGVRMLDLQDRIREWTHIVQEHEAWENVDPDRHRNPGLAKTRKAEALEWLPIRRPELAAMQAELVALKSEREQLEQLMLVP